MRPIPASVWPNVDSIERISDGISSPVQPIESSVRQPSMPSARRVRRAAGLELGVVHASTILGAMDAASLEISQVADAVRRRGCRATSCASTPPGC